MHLAPRRRHFLTLTTQNYAKAARQNKLTNSMLQNLVWESFSKVNDQVILASLLRWIGDTIRIGLTGRMPARRALPRAPDDRTLQYDSPYGTASEAARHKSVVKVW